MSKYKIGDKFVIEIGEEFIGNFDTGVPESKPLYRINGFNSLVFDKNGLDKLERSPECAKQKAFDNGYIKGIQDAWELARKIVLTVRNGGMSGNDFIRVFPGYQTYERVLKELSYEQALAKIEAYEKEQNEIKVGDVVKVTNGHEFVVTCVSDDNYLFGITNKGDSYTAIPISKCKKIGKHIDIQGLLNQIGE